jgi:hypothetical protein
MPRLIVNATICTLTKKPCWSSWHRHLAAELVFQFVVGRGIYYDYILFPKLKADEHYIGPTRWQDFTFLG